jgi:excisionase family DNA binding protein
MAQDARTDTPQQPFPPLALDVREAAETLGLSHSKVYQLIASGEIYHRRVGKRILIPRKALEAFVDGRPYERGALQ